MNRESLQAWLDKYIEAWRTYDRAKIGDLFSQDALYYYNPFDGHDPVRGRKAIVASWLEDRDDPGLWEARYEPVAVEGQVGVAQGRTGYLLTDGTVEREYANIFVLEFDEVGRCLRFTEWYMKAVKPGV